MAFHDGRLRTMKIINIKEANNAKELNAFFSRFTSTLREKQNTRKRTKRDLTSEKSDYRRRGKKAYFAFQRFYPENLRSHMIFKNACMGNDQ